MPVMFASPLLLLALVALPALWWLLRVTPPRPREVVFPPTVLMGGLEQTDSVAAHTPWWLLLLRCLIAATIIVFMAGPSLNTAQSRPPLGGPLALLMDDGWPAAPAWEARLEAAEAEIARAEQAGQGVALVLASRPAAELQPATPQQARDILRATRPVAFSPDRAAHLPALARFLAARPHAQILYLSDGVDAGGGADFLARLAETARGRLRITGGEDPAMLALRPPKNGKDGIMITASRLAAAGERSALVRALDKDMRPLGEASLLLKEGESTATARLNLPLELKNDIASFAMVNAGTAGAVQLVDGQFRRRLATIISGESNDIAQPLLLGRYYLTRALEPFADLRTMPSPSPLEALAQAVDGRIPAIVLTDTGPLPAALRDRLRRHVEDGAVLIRFAGPRLIETQDELLPVRLRRTDRQFGGALSWDVPQSIAPFAKDSPFAGLTPPADVTISRQVLAEPDAALASRIWASLGDGTPLVTAERRGNGLIVLFHVTADASWSNLPLSGLFIAMLKKTIDFADLAPQGDQGPNAAPIRRLPPLMILNGHGAFAAPPPTAKAVASGWQAAATADHPAGLYGNGPDMLAINAVTAASPLEPLPLAGFGGAEPLGSGAMRDLRPALGLLALLLFMLDTLLHVLPGRRPAVTALMLLALAMPPLPRAMAQASHASDLTETLAATRLAYVRSGVAQVDRIAAMGLASLTGKLAERTSLEGAPPVAVSVEDDEIAIYPILYWPVVVGAPPLSAKAMVRLDAFMKSGGLIIFDTRDADIAGGAETDAQATLRAMLSGLSIPPLEPVPADHVLGKTFFILKDFPGRFSRAPLWVEALPQPSDEDRTRPARGGDSVSPLIITGNDLAGAWALDGNGAPLLPMADGERQREMAFRVGINIVMYALTGNYKSDQVHVPALLQRLGN